MELEPFLQTRPLRPYVLLAFGVATLAVVATLVASSLDPDNYFYYSSQDRSDWRHPTRHVAWVGVLVIVETTLAGLALGLRTRWPLWRQGAAALFLLIPWAMFSTLFVIHMPAYVLLHHLWLWLIVIVLFVVTLAAGLWRWSSRDP